MVGTVIVAEKDIRTGKYTELEGVYELPEIKKKGGQGDNKPSFDQGDNPERTNRDKSRGDRSAPVPMTVPATDDLDLPFDMDEEAVFDQ